MVKTYGVSHERSLPTHYVATIIFENRITSIGRDANKTQTDLHGCWELKIVGPLASLESTEH